jgi:hypothetical protein
VGSGSGGVVDDAFDLAAVDAEVAGDGALAAACPGCGRVACPLRSCASELGGAMRLASHPLGVLASVVGSAVIATAGDGAARADTSGPARPRIVSIRRARPVIDSSVRLARSASAM